MGRNVASLSQPHQNACNCCNGHSDREIGQMVPSNPPITLWILRACVIDNVSLISYKELIQYARCYNECCNKAHDDNGSKQSLGIDDVVFVEWRMDFGHNKPCEETTEEAKEDRNADIVKLANQYTTHDSTWEQANVEILSANKALASEGGSDEISNNSSREGKHGEDSATVKSIRVNSIDNASEAGNKGPK